MTHKLKPCPFCGGEARSFAAGGAQYVVSCQGCNVSYLFLVDNDFDAAMKEVAERWNRRACAECRGKKTEERS